MKKLVSALSLVLAIMMLCTCALANEQKYDEPVTVHFVRSTDDTLDANYFAYQDDSKSMTNNLWTDLYRDELNIIVEYDWIVKSGEEYDQKLAAELAVGAIPEFVNVTALQVKQLYEAGLIMPLEDIYEEYATEQTKEVMLQTGTSPFDAVTFDGHLYALPVVGESLMIADLVWIRSDWLEKLGLEAPTTMDELIEVAKAFCAADFDGNGVDDTIGLAVSKTPWDQLFTLKGFFNAYDSYPEIWVDDGNGNLVYGSTLPGTKDALATLHQMYVDGLLDPEFAIKDDGKVAESTTAGKCGIAFGAQWNSIYPFRSAVELDLDAQWTAYPIVTATDHQAKAQTDVGTTSWTVVRKDCEHPEAVVKMYNLFIDKCWGPENENGVYYAPLDCESIWKLSPVTPTKPSKNLDAYLDLEAGRQSGDNSNINGEAYSILLKLDSYAAYTREEVEAMAPTERGGYSLVWAWERIYGSGGAYGVLNYYKENDLHQHMMFVGAPTDTMTYMMSTLKDLQNEVFIKIITGEESIDAFDKFVEDFMSMGGEQITAEVNEWYASVK